MFAPCCTRNTRTITLSPVFYADAAHYYTVPPVFTPYLRALLHPTTAIAAATVASNSSFNTATIAAVRPAASPPVETSKQLAGVGSVSCNVISI